MITSTPLLPQCVAHLAADRQREVRFADLPTAAHRSAHATIGTAVAGVDDDEELAFGLCAVA